MKKIERELRREFADCEIELTNGNHYRITTPSRKIIFTSSTPSYQRAIRDVRAAVRRAMREQRSP